VSSGASHERERPDELAAEQSVPALLASTAQLLVDGLGASACTISRAIGDLLVDLVDHSAGGPVQAAHSYLISDFPLTQAVLDKGEPRRVWVEDAAADPEEAALMRRLGFDSLLLLRLDCDAKPWGLIEVYDNRQGGFAQEQLEAAQRIVESASLELSRLSSR
jgi:transcriptional regulator with GAF, ATPase, and Fis domain